eukprot:scaffold1.g5782.t1
MELLSRFNDTLMEQVIRDAGLDGMLRNFGGTFFLPPDNALRAAAASLGLALDQASPPGPANFTTVAADELTVFYDSTLIPFSRGKDVMLVAAQSNATIWYGWPGAGYDMRTANGAIVHQINGLLVPADADVAAAAGAAPASPAPA